MRFLKSLFGRRASPEPQTGSDPSEELGAALARISARPPRPVAKPRARVITDLTSFPFEVVGESNYQNVLVGIAGGYRRENQAIERTAMIVLDPGNQHDPNAIRVEIDGQTVGFLPAAAAPRVGGFMREQGVESAAVEAVVNGGWRTSQRDQGRFGVRLRLPRYGWIDFGVGAREPGMPSTGARSRPRKSLSPEPAPHGPLRGQWVVLWGFRRDGDVAHEIAAAGGRIMAGVGKSTTIVVRDDGDITPGMKSSATWKRFEERRTAGGSVDMMTWRELKALVARYSAED